MNTSRLRGLSDPYRAAHDRTRALKGRADTHLCQICKDPAREWALKPKAECLGNLGVVRKDGRAYWFSDDPGDYRPLCATDHRNADAQERVAEEVLA